MAARIGNQFKIDPVMVLNDDKWNALIRSAAYVVIQDDMRAAQEKNRRTR